MIPLFLLLQTVAATSEPVIIERWQRPWVVAKLIVEIPYGFGGGVEVYVQNRWSTGIDVNFSPVGTFTRVSAHYWPTVNVGKTHSQFLLGIGGDLSGNFSEIAGGLAIIVIPASFDVRYLVRPFAFFGFVVGVRAGAGFATQVRETASPVSFAASLVTYVGLAFGSH